MMRQITPEGVILRIFEHEKEGEALQSLVMALGSAGVVLEGGWD